MKPWIHDQLGKGLLISATLLALPAWAERPCTAELTKGRWMYSCEGTLPAPEQTNTRILGFCEAKPNGHFSCNGTANLGGNILSQGLEGLALTERSCRGTISYAQTINGVYVGQLDIQYVVSEGGKAIDGLPVNSGGVLACKLRRIDP
jgi:hypothetical protein